MKRLDRYLLKTYIGPFFMTFLVVVFIFLMQFVWKYIDDLVGKGLEWTVLLRLMGYTACTFIPMSLPLALLLSGLMTFGNLGERFELTAIKSSGIPLYRIMRPLILFAVVCSAGNFFLSNNLVPYANLKSTMLLRDIRTQKPALSIEEKVFYKGIDNYVIRIGKKDKDNQTVHDILIYDHSNGNSFARLTHAKEGSMVMDEKKQLLVFTLKDGFYFDEDMQKSNDAPERRLLMRGTFQRQTIRFDISSFQFSRSDEDVFKTNYTALNVKQLGRFIDSIRSEIGEKRQYLSQNMLLQFGAIRSCLQDTLSPLPDTLVLMPLNAQEQFSAATNALQKIREQQGTLEFYNMDQTNQNEQLWRYEIEWHRKFTLCAACLILFFIGAPLGSIIRKGGIGIPLTISILIFVFYWVVSTIGERMARIGSLTSAQGMWISSLILLPIGLFLIFKSTRESQWLEFFQQKHIRTFIRKKFRKKNESITDLQ
ncbi:MAG: LptF/LptG family permease [Bacteroidales bacterium]|nr:LptF/LptG family permease [Bacteroidales bacterium]MBQ5532993.1 LptF/LptG family permease [Bacteroidales bacterium]MCR5190252.1 LptF/LptG family permease [Bacteroidales bacterium]